MIKFFRHIRRTLLMENKTSKYLKYAIGEIVLVVIGILIALQINIWNQGRKESSKETNYLLSIKSDLKEQLGYIETQKTYELSYIKAANPVLSYYNTHQRFSFDREFYEHITTLNSRKTFTTTDPTFIDLISSGNINLIKNESLRKQIISYYQELELTEKIIQNNNTLVVDQQYADIMHRVSYYYYPNDRGYLRNHKNLDSMVQKSIETTKVFNTTSAATASKILDDPIQQLQLMNVLNHRHIITLGHYQRAITMEKKTLALIDAISEELNRK